MMKIYDKKLAYPYFVWMVLFTVVPLFIVVYYAMTDAEGSSQFGRRRKVASGEVANAGYYTVLLDKTVTLEAGERFAVIVEITTPGAIHPVAIEYSSSDKGLTVDLSDGEGYISYRGSSWERGETEQNCNVCLKAYTRNVDSWN